MAGFFKAAALALAGLAATALPASAQEPLLSSIAPKADPVAAVDSAYGRFVVVEVTRIIEANTEASCRQAQGLDEESLRKKVRDTFIAHGHMWYAFTALAIDNPGFAQTFDMRAGEGALREWQQLLAQPLG
ncbi:MAG: hypothetical protein WAN86_17080 [Hyphomicrobiaceae bacterium]